MLSYIPVSGAVVFGSRQQGFKRVRVVALHDQVAAAGISARQFRYRL